MPKNISLIDILGNQDLSVHSIDHSVQSVLDGIRKQLQMKVGFVSQFVSDARVFLFVSSEGDNCGVDVGAWDPLEESFCHHIAKGSLPQLMRDAARAPLAKEMAATTNLPVGAHIGVPLVFSDGKVFGSICCFSQKPDLDLSDRDLFLVQVAAGIVAELMERHLEHLAEIEQTRDRIKKTIDCEGFEIVYQPIVSLGERRVYGLEALARFPDSDLRPPTAWFQDARDVDLLVELDLALIRRAIQILPQLPKSVYISINVTASTVLSGRLPEALACANSKRLVIELSEHEAVEDYEALNKRFQKISGQWRLAVDDVGAGYSSMRHILDVGPEIMKLDMTFVRDIDRRPSRSALVKAIMAFAEASGTLLIAEGIETKDESVELQRLGVKFGQGYHFAAPMTKHDALSLGRHV